jgi:hypothetical protein
MHLLQTTFITLGILAASVSAYAQEEEFNRPYDALLKSHVSQGQVDYAGLGANRAALDRYVKVLGVVSASDYKLWPPKRKIAFWINAYNAITLKVILDHYPITKRLLPVGLAFPVNSIQQIPGKWDKVTHTVLRQPRTLDQIEHQILRQEFKEPRIHMALVCAAQGCPPLRSEAYHSHRLDEQLRDQTKRFLSHPLKFELSVEKKTVKLSPIFKWFGADFIGDGPVDRFGNRSDAEQAVLSFIAGHLSVGEQTFLQAGDYRVQYLGYDWSLNEQ